MALSLKGEPVAENMGTTCKYSQFHTFVAGDKSANQTITTEATIVDGINTHTWDMIMFNESSRHLGLESKMSQGMVG